MKITSLLLCVIIPAAMSAAAQTTAQSASPDYAASWPGAVTCIEDSAVSKPGYMNNISIAAVRDFVSRFKTASDPRWFKLQDGSCVARFAEPGIDYRVGYNRQGKWIYTMRAYGEKLLPQAVRHLVKSNYYDFTITGAVEIEQHNITGPVYMIYQKDDSCFMTLRVHDGEMETQEKLLKARKK